ncbi:MAG: ATP-grasp domain-containing protein, partial [Proteobacteria bacterium]|nr:ATP-grasp domain-containing protein [Pseudomonadota bacterium]
MNVIILSPHFPPNHINYARALKAYGDTALGIGDSPWICDELRDTLDEYVYVPDMTNYDAMLRAVAYLTSKYGKIDRIDSQNEFWLGIESQLREDFNIFGHKPAHTDINRSKLEMKRVARAAGIPVAEGMEVEDVHQLREFAKKVGFPLVVKPVVGVGASATYPLNNEDDIEHCFEYIHGRYIVEQYIHGDIVTFDGFVDRHGRIIFKTSHEYNAG